MTTPSGPALDRIGDMLAQHEAGTLAPIEDERVAWIPAAKFRAMREEFQASLIEEDVRPYPDALSALTALIADVATAMSALYEIRDHGEGRHEEGDDGETVSAYVDQAARPVVEELRDALRRWGE